MEINKIKLKGCNTYIIQLDVTPPDKYKKLAYDYDETNDIGYVNQVGCDGVNWDLFEVDYDKKTINGYRTDELQNIYDINASSYSDFSAFLEKITGVTIDRIAKSVCDDYREECDNLDENDIPTYDEISNCIYQSYFETFKSIEINRTRVKDVLSLDEKDF